MFKKIFKKKIIIPLLIVLILGGYFAYQKLTRNKEEIRYVTAAVERGTLVVSVSGSGQAAVSDQVEIKPKVSGQIVFFGASAGQEVKAGALLVQLNTRDAQKAVWNAEINLTNAQLALKDIKAETEEALETAYQEALNVLTNTFKELSAVMPVLKEIFLKSSYGGDESDIDYYLRLIRTYDRDAEQLSYWLGSTEQKYLVAQRQFDAAQKGYWQLSPGSSRDQVETILNQTYDTARQLLELVRQTFNLAQKYQAFLETENLTSAIPAAATANQISQLTEFTSSLINRVDALSLVRSSLDAKKEAAARANVDIETQNLSLKQCEYALADAKENLEQHYIYAPLEGIVTEVNSGIKKGDSVSAGAVLATLITKQKIAKITLNEVDAAKVKVGQKASLTFDALPDLNIAGKVIEVDAAGQVSQGVVSYGVKIAFDTDAEQVKPGMSVTADIIIEAKQNVLLVPNSAVKSQQNIYYVQVMENNTPRSQQVEIGISNDTDSEIVSGLKEGDVVVTATMSPTAVQATQTQSTQQFQIPGMGAQMRMR